MDKLGLLDINSEYEEVLAILFFYPALILLFVIIIASAVGRFLLQCLCCYLVKKYIDKNRNKEIITLNIDKTY